MRALTWMGVVVALLLGCEREPDELQFVVGKVVSAEGKPLPGQVVRFERNGSPMCNAPSYATVDAGTFVPAGEFTANERGDFLFEVTHRDTQTDEASSSGLPACFHVVAEGEGGVSTVSFMFGSGSVELADLPVREARATAEWADGGVALDSHEQVSLQGYTWSASQWLLRSGEQVAWRQEGAGAAALPAWAAEDFGALNAVHETLGEWVPPYSPIAVEYSMGATASVRSGSVPLDAGQVVPSSRGAACEPGAVDGGACPLTDGKVEPVSWVPVHSGNPDAGLPPPPPEALTLDLGAPRAMKTLVVRGLAFDRPAEDLWVETSVDGVTWTRAASLGAFAFPTTDDEWRELSMDDRDGYFAQVTLETSGPQRFVRLKGKRGTLPNGPPGGDPGPVRFLRASELSVFE